MGLRPSSQNCNNAVQKYIGTGYDTVKKVADNIDDVTLVAESVGDLNTTSDNIDSIVEVSNDISSVIEVADKMDSVTNVGTNITEVINTGSNIPDIITVSGSINNVNNVSGNIQEIGTVAGNINDVNIVAENVDNLNEIIDLDIPALTVEVLASKDDAENAANRAEAAADVATLNGQIWDTVQDGIDNTVNGDYFSVVSSTAENYLDLYKNDGGSAVLQKSYPSTNNRWGRGNLSDNFNYVATLGSGDLISTATSDGVYYGANASNHGDAPVDDTLGANAFTVECVRPIGNDRWVYQSLRRFTSPDREWFRRLDTQNPSGSEGWVKVSGLDFVTNNMLQSNSVTELKIANNSISESKIVDNSITENKIANNSVTENKIPDNSLSAAKLKNSIVDNSKLADGYMFVGNITSGDLLTTVNLDGLHYGSSAANHADAPVSAYLDTRAFTLKCERILGSDRWINQTLNVFGSPERVWVRRVDYQNQTATAWSYISGLSSVVESSIRDKNVTRGKLSDDYGYVRTVLASDSSYNNLTESGEYIISTDIHDRPADGMAFLTVKNMSNGQWVIQNWISADNPDITYRRVIRPNSGVYNEWVMSGVKTGVNTLAGKTIAFIGDSITEFGDYPERTGEKLGATALKFGFGGCRMAQHSSSASGQAYDTMCMYNIARQMASGDYSELIAGAQLVFDMFGDDNRPQAAALAGTDWNAVDVLVIAFGTNDYVGPRTLGNETDNTPDGSTFMGAINYIIEVLVTAYPSMQIYFVAPPWRSRIAVGDGKDADVVPNAGGVFLYEYVDAILKVAELNHMKAYDTFRDSGINKYNATTLLDDGLHPKAPEGYELLANRVAGFLRSSYG